MMLILNNIMENIRMFSEKSDKYLLLMKSYYKFTMQKYNTFVTYSMIKTHLTSVYYDSLLISSLPSFITK